MLHFSKLFCLFLRFSRAPFDIFDRGLAISLFERKKNDWQAKEEDGKWMDVTKHNVERFWTLWGASACKKTPKELDHFACLSAYISRALKIFHQTMKKMLCASKRVLLFSYVHFIGDMPYNFHRNFGLRKLRTLYSRCKHPLNFVL